MILVSYNDESDKMTVKSTSAWFPAECYGNSYDHVPAYPQGDDANGYIRFDSKEPGMLNIDYGDGIKEQKMFKQLNDGTYRLVLCSYDLDYYKNPNSSEWGTLKSGGRLIPEYPHRYTDGEMKERTIVMEFTNKISLVRATKIKMDEFPVLDLPSVGSLYFSVITMNDASIDVDKIVRADSLTIFVYDTIRNAPNIQFPVGLLKATQLRSLNLTKSIDMSNPESNGIRGISVLSNLESLKVAATNGKPIYLKEYNDLPKLRTLDIRCDADQDLICETDTINPALTAFQFLSLTNGPLSSWRENIQGRGIEKITGIDCGHGPNIPVDVLPEYFKEMRAWESFIGSYTFIRTQQRADTFVDSIYEYVTNWEQITMSQTAKDGKRNQFYNLRFNMWSSYYPHAQRPSGTYQAPAGFEQGVSNGQPATPMEKIYVLTQNYKQTWSVKPETSTFSIAEIKRMLGAKDYRYTLVMPEDGIPFVAEGDVLTPYKKTGFDTEEEARLICDSLELSDEKVIEYFKNQQDHE